MRPAVVLALVSMLLPAAAVAHADSVYHFTLSDTDPNTGSLSFGLSPSTPNMGSDPSTLQYVDVAGTEDGQPTTFDDVNFATYNGTEYLGVVDANNNVYLEAFFNGLFAQAGSGGAGMFTPGTYLGGVDCDAKLRSPFVSSGLPATMAFLQLQFPFTTTCGGSLQMSVTGPSGGTGTPSSVTPEPASLGLLATGALALAGVVRRRLRA